MPLPTVKGVGTFYNEYGNPRDKHVLFIHGLGSSSLAWRDMIDMLWGISGSLERIHAEGK